MFIFGSKNIKKSDDAELINKYQESENNKYVGILFEKYSHLVFGLCLKYLKDETESKDAVLLIFENLLTELKNNKITHFATWLYSVSRNHCLMHLRKHKRFEKRKEEFETEEINYSTDNCNIELQEAQLNKLQEVLLQLKPDQKECIELFYLQGKCYKEIIDITGYTWEQVRSNIQNGRRNLKLLLLKENEFATI